MNLKIGSHVSMAKGLEGAVTEALSYGAKTFMIYTGPPQNTRRSPIERLKVKEGWDLMRENGIDEFVVHAPYIINLASHKENIFELAVDFLSEEISRTEQLGAKHIVLHPGAFTETNLEYGANRIADGLNQVFRRDSDVLVCLETMSGKGTEIGKTFEELKMIYDLTKRSDRLRVCFDTCHTHDYGYNVAEDFEGVMKEFGAALGTDQIEIFHLNGSLNPRGAKKDRHANIGAVEGNPKGADFIGLDAIRNIARSKYARDKFLILETPWLNASENLYKQEIEAILKD
jgi:deoxyribonuclease-4